MELFTIGKGTREQLLPSLCEPSYVGFFKNISPSAFQFSGKAKVGHTAMFS